MSHLKAYIVILTILFGSIFPCMGQIDTEQLIRIGANTHYFEDYVLSIQYFNRAIALNPNQAKPYFYRSIAKLTLEDYAGAEEDATHAIERNPFINEAYEVRGIARQNMGKYVKAIEDYDKALEYYPDNSGILFNKALAQFDANDTVASAATFEQLIKKYPRYENAYTGRARLRLEMKDTIGAKEDIERALKINSNTINAYILRADIAIKSGENYKDALSDMDIAVKIEPNSAGLYINRAYLRYMNDDIRGAFEDYDKALELEPLNTVAIFNRGLLRAEVHDTNHAIEDFTTVIGLNPDDYKTLFNRAILLAEIEDYNGALADIGRVIDAFPDFAAAYFLRFDIKRRKGDMRGAQKDYDHSLSLAKTNVQLPAERQFAVDTSDRDEGELATSDTGTEGSSESDNRRYESQDQIKRRFTSLTTVSDNYSHSIDYSSASEIRGKVQDKEMKFDLEPIFLLTYYTSPTEIKLNNEYIREVDEINSSKLLRFGIQVANREATLDEDERENIHRSSIEYYNSYISSHSPRAIDYFGRAMDYVTVKDYSNAINDLDRAIALTPDFVLAYLLRSQAQYLRAVRENNSHAYLREALADINRVIELSPSLSIAPYNKGIILSLMGNKDEAIKSFTQAIELKPNFGEAFFNRGYEYLSIGNAIKAFPDLSRAGELGIVPSYALLKRMGAQ